MGTTLYLESSYIMHLKSMVEYAINDSNDFEKVVHFPKDGYQKKAKDKVCFDK
jgi:hypothetical protein